MPRKPSIVKPMATRKHVANRKPSGPARPMPLLDATGVTCQAASCSRPAVVFHRWTWWCSKHDPGDKPDPNCSHINNTPSPILGVLVCSFCGGRTVDDE